VLERRGLVQLDQPGVGRLDVDEGAVSALLEAGGYIDLSSLALGGPEAPIRTRPVIWDLIDAVVEELAGHSGMQLSRSQLLVYLKPAHEAQSDWI